MSAGAPPVAMLAATRLSTKTLFPVPIRRLMVWLPVLAVKTYFPTLVIQQSARLTGGHDRCERAIAEQAVLIGMCQGDEGGPIAVDGKAERRQGSLGRGHCGGSGPSTLPS